MTFPAPAPSIGRSENMQVPEVMNDLSPLLSNLQADEVSDVIFGILDQYSVRLDTQSYPANLYAESLLYMVYWFHRLRDPIRKNGIEESIRKYLKVDRQSGVANGLLSDINLKIAAKQHIDQGVMVRKTVDVLVIREGQNGREFLTLERTVFPEGIALPGGLLKDEDENNETGIPSNIFAALRVTASKVFASAAPEYGISEADGRKYYFVRNKAGRIQG